MNKNSLNGNATMAPTAGGPGGGGGGPVVADGVSIDGTGTGANPLSVIPAYILALVGGAGGWTRVDVAASVQNLDIAIDGETGYVFEALCYFTDPAVTGATYFLRPNATTTNQAYQEIYGQAAAAAGAAAGNLTIGFAGGSGGKCIARFTFLMKSGTVRLLFGDYCNLDNANAIASYDTLGGVWTDTATAITSLRIHADQATGIGAGSYVLYRTIGLA